MTASQPGLMRTVVIGICGVLLVLFVLRPVARQVTATLREPMLLTAGAKASAALARSRSGCCRLSRSGDLRMKRRCASAASARKSRAQRQQQGIFEHVSEHIRREPAQSTRLLEAWIGSSEEGE